MQGGDVPRIVDDGTDENAWRIARRSGISASVLPKAMTPAGRIEVIQDMLWPTGDDGRFAEYREHGKRREAEFLGQWIADRFGMRHNTALYAHDDHPRHLATPDGIGDGVLYELKTSTKDMPATIPRTYRDQMTWQAYVMQVPRVLLVWERHRDFIATGLPEWRWFTPDEDRLQELIAVADGLLFEYDMRMAEREAE